MNANMNRLIAEFELPSYLVSTAIAKHGQKKVIETLQAMKGRPDIRNPRAWFESVLEGGKFEPREHRQVHTAVNPAAREMFTEEGYRRQCEELERLSDPNHWADSLRRSFDFGKAEELKPTKPTKPTGKLFKKLISDYTNMLSGRYPTGC